MIKHRILVAGATGQIGAQNVHLLLDQGHYVRALVRRPDAQVLGLDGAGGTLDYAVGALEDRASLVKALDRIDTVVSSANGIIPSGKTMSVKAMSAGGYEDFISAAEEAGVRHWVQSSVPCWDHEKSVPELAGKRLIEDRLARSPIATTIVRNPAFMDVWLVMAGARQATAHHPHATTKRNYGFMKMWQGLVGNLVAKRGILLAPGVKAHGAPFVATIDVAHMMAGVVGKQASYNRTLEAGGPEWLTWGEVATLLSKKTGRPVRVVTLPAWFARLGQGMMTPVSPSAANILALVRLVASHQPRWEAPSVVEEFDLPPQTTVAEYLDRNWSDGADLTSG
ncbi:SDR family oxidoreductase [Litoreibacter roseus]|uniref:3-beta hydroxysteroid dehydrogenase n=1 Tax=Litoreibacter roseus TaxID=2601869 RepID=A0A6N6JHR5_9RHOB|nr:NmrA family NAD(P)-binding protein [Litoreibacter roseus]GFE65881.1 3-beta hydroxysteroid dehydrogenase [Litoreibacter roseus]